jgi:pyrroloquinoline quinone biosynthesis protein D
MPEAPPLADATVLELVRQFRLQFEPAQDAHVLLFPEGMIKLSGSAGEIMSRIDGTASVGAIVADLQKAFPGAELRADVVEFLLEAQRKGWVRVKQPQ